MAAFGFITKSLFNPSRQAVRERPEAPPAHGAPEGHHAPSHGFIATQTIRVAAVMPAFIGGTPGGLEVIS
jgi:hypothetical protein